MFAAELHETMPEMDDRYKARGNMMRTGENDPAPGIDDAGFVCHHEKVFVPAGKDLYDPACFCIACSMPFPMFRKGWRGVFQR
jgi:hypothetical protein